MSKPSFCKVAITSTILAAAAMPTFGQTSEKLLTVEQCRADARVYQKNDAVDPKLLQYQLGEMHECESTIDKRNGQQYHALVDEVSAKVFAVTALDKIPTIEQCRADAKLYEKDEAVDLPITKWLAHQSAEMHACEIVIDKTNWRRYHVLSDKFLMAISLREQDFISRHNLDAQFVAEDEAGKR